MTIYKLTAFKEDGHKALDEVIEATSKEEAKNLAKKRLQEQNLYESPYRLTSSKAELIDFL